MEELERLIQKFWAKETTSVENKRLLELLEIHKGDYKDLVQYEFNEADPDHSHRLDPQRASELLQKIHANLMPDETYLFRDARIPERKPFSIRRLVLRIAIAASVVIATGIGLLVSRHRENSQLSKNAEQPVPRLIQLVNSSNADMPVLLRDGSSIQLHKNSGISYYEPFINGRRDISLNGIALFKVARDKTKPFTVYAGGIITDVLGTQFLVNASDPKKVIVRLLEGKVAVHAAGEPGLTMAEQDLKPGQEILIDKSSNRFLVKTAGTDKNKTISRSAGVKNKVALAFQQDPLDVVFRKIGILYHVPVSFREQEIAGLHFTGTFLKSDDLNLILSTICHLNDLQFTKEQDSIFITRGH